MNMHASDQEQIQMLKDFWKQYGTTILAALLTFAVVNFGWRYWHNYTYVRMERASVIYTQMLNANNLQKPDEVQLFGKRLEESYASTSYASLAAMTLAKEAVKQGKLDNAYNQLEWVIKHGHDASLRQIARIRAARILIEQKQGQAALDLLAKIDAEAFMVSINEARGDAYTVLGKTSDAKKAYAEATKSEKSDLSAPLLKMKNAQ
jgi:predicted negative regulator of RcsB-dependent stress response